MKTITSEYLGTINACQDAITAFAEKFPKGAPVRTVFAALLKGNKLDWANWLVARLLNSKDRIRYAIYAAEQVIEIYEKKYPDDTRPRKAIEAAKAVLKINNKANRDAAYAAYAAANAANAAYAAYAAYAANAAANAAYAAANAAYAASAAYAANDANAAAYDAKDEMKKKIILYGLKLLEVKP